MDDHGQKTQNQEITVKLVHGAISRIGRPNNPFEPRRNRYATKILNVGR